MVVIAPAFAIPLPFTEVRGSAVTKVNPFRSSIAPLVIVVPAVVVPSGVFAPDPAPPSLRTPAEMVVTPV